MLRRRHAPASSARADAGPPRLVLRFALTTCVGLAIAGAAILLFVRHSNTVQAERAATSEARVIASAALRGELAASDFERGVTRERRAALDSLFEQHVLEAGVLVALLYADDGTVTYSTDHRLIGTKATELAHLAEAKAGTIRGDVTTAPPTGPDGETPKALRVYAPVAVPDGTGVVAMYQDYGPIARAAESAFLPVAGIFEVVLLLLFVVLVPILRRVTKRIQRQMDEIEYRALYDELTGLPNRTLFRDRAQQAIASARREGGAASVLFLDVDRFREVNDALGHEAGDALLREIGGRLGAVLREADTLARLGGDEFAVLLPATGMEDATLLAARVHEALEPAFALGEFPLDVASSIGIASFPEHGEDVDALLQHADVAMYVAKDAHAGTAVYDVELDTNDAARLALAGELRRAIERGELVVHYQPKADLSSGRVVGAEALVRWEHPEHGLLPSDRFVPIAERTGLIRQLTLHVLEIAARQATDWEKAGLDLDVAVNLDDPRPARPRAPGPDRGAPARDRSRAGEARARDHRVVAPRRPLPRPAGADAAERDGAPARDRRLRHRLLVARVPQAPAGAGDQDRPLVRLRHVRRSERRDDRALDDRPRPEPRARDRRGGRRVARDLERAPRPRLLAGPGVPHRATDARGRARRADRLAV